MVSRLRYYAISFFYCYCKSSQYYINLQIILLEFYYYLTATFVVFTM